MRTHHRQQHGRAAIGSATRSFRNRLFRKVVLQDGEDFPLVPVRDRGPTLYPAARSSILFSFRREAAILAPATSGARPGRRRSTPPEFPGGTMRRARASAPSFKVKLSGGFATSNFAYPVRTLQGSIPKSFAVKFDARGDVFHVDRNMGLARFHGFRCHGSSRHDLNIYAYAYVLYHTLTLHISVKPYIIAGMPQKGKTSSRSTLSFARWPIARGFACSTSSPTRKFASAISWRS